VKQAHPSKGHLGAERATDVTDLEVVHCREALLVKGLPTTADAKLVAAPSLEPTLKRQVDQLGRGVALKLAPRSEAGKGAPPYRDLLLVVRQRPGARLP